MKTIFQHSLYNFLYDEENNLLIFDWTEATINMTDEDFIEALSNYVGFAYDFKGPRLLVDVTKFHHKIGKTTQNWRNRKVVPRLLNAKSNKLGYVFPIKALEYMAKDEVKTGVFTDKYFGSRKDATLWLTS